MQTTVDDNGTAADFLRDSEWSFQVDYTDFDIVTDATLV